MRSKVRTEVHTHTCASQHASSTVLEMIHEAQRQNLELLAITEHAPAIPDGVNLWGLRCHNKFTPHKVDSLYVLFGAEANIIDYDGHVDLPASSLQLLDLVIASIHRPCLLPSTVEAHTNTYIKALENPWIDALGHSGSPDFSYDIDAVLEVIKREDKAIELNNNTFFTRKRNWENCKKIAKRCADLNVKVILSTDAHSTFTMGNTDQVWALAMESGIREEQIVNLTADRFLDYLCNRKGWERSRFENTIPGSWI